MEPLLFFLTASSIGAIIVGIGFYVHNLKYKKNKV